MKYIVTGRAATLSRRMATRVIGLAITITLAGVLWMSLTAAPQAHAQTPLPPTNAAANYACGSGQFCLWYVTGGTGPRYASEHTDLDLRDNLFASTNLVVSKNSEGFNNNGVYDDVLVFDRPGATGPAQAGRCIRKGQHGDLPSDWQNRIMSFRFVSRTACNLYPRLIPGS
jgi:hypothetical protein